MPTGYTKALEDNGYDLKKWIKQDIARGMGMCVMLRDDGPKTEAEILESFSESNYHAEALQKAIAAFQYSEVRTQKDWEFAYKKELTTAMLDYDKRVEETNAKIKKHKKCQAQVTEMLNQATARREGEAVVNSLKLACEQLETAMDFDYGGPVYREEILNQTLEEFVKKSKKDAYEQVQSRTVSLAAERERTASRREAYQSLVDFVNRF